MKWKEGQQFENPAGGSHIARCYAVIDLGTQQHSWQNDHWSQADVTLNWELAHEKMTGKYNSDAKGKPFMVQTTVKQSLHKKARLRKLLEGWRGKAFGEGEAEKFDPKKLVGLGCRLVLVQSQNSDFMDVTAIAPLTKDEAAKLKGHKWFNKTVFFSLDPFDPEVYKALSEKTREKIMKSPEYKAVVGDGPAEEPQADPAEEPLDDDGGTGDPDVPF